MGPYPLRFSEGGTLGSSKPLSERLVLVKKIKISPEPYLSCRVDEGHVAHGKG